MKVKNKKSSEEKQMVIARRIKKIQQSRGTLEVCAALITKAGYHISVRKLSHIEAGISPGHSWSFLVAFCKAMVKTPNEVLDLKPHT